MKRLPNPSRPSVLAPFFYRLVAQLGVPRHLLGFIVLLLRQLVALSLLGSSLWAQSAFAATFTVTNLNDSGSGSLRQAIMDANANGTGADTIDLAGLSGTINLNSSLPTFTGTTIVNGPGATVLTVNGGSFTIFTVANGIGLQMSGLRVTGGAVSTGLNAAQLEVGGGTAIISNSSFENTSGFSAVASFVTLTMINVMIANAANTALINGGTATLTNVTISGAANGIDQSSGPTVSTTLVNCTIANTNIGLSVNLRVGESHSLTLKNTIFSNILNLRIGQSGGPALNLVSQGNNLFSDATLTTTAAGDLLNTNPLLGTLGNYGGNTMTLPLLPGSPAINAGTASGATTTDQRGFARVGATDIGAFESRGFTMALSSGNNQSTAINTAFSNPLIVTVSSANSEPVNGGQVTFTPPGSGASSSIAGSPAIIASGAANSGTVTANGTVGGPYTVAASARGVTTGVNFSLTNTPLSADLSITKTDGVTTATAGGSTTYTITASNAGPSNASSATVADTFPASLTCNWTCVGAGGGTCTASGSGNINNSVNLPSGGSVTYTASCTVSAAATGTLSNTATVAAPGGVTDPSPGNNSATDSDTLAASSDLSIIKTDGVTTATPGGSTTYTITASNAGPSNAPIVTVADTFPSLCTGVSYTSLTAGGATGNTASALGNIRDAALNLPAGSSVTYTAHCAISQTATGSLTNTASVSSTVSDPSPGNNSATDADTLSPLSLPLAVHDNALATLNTPLLIDVLANDQPFSTANLPTVNIKRPFRRGIKARRDGQVQFTPRVDDSASETFTYTFRDTNGTLSNIATVTVDFDNAPTVSAVTPGNAATNVGLSDPVVITFNEAVNVSSAWFQIACSVSGLHPATPSGGPTVFTLDPVSNFANGETCTLTVTAPLVADQDSIDPPDTMTANFISTFSTLPAP